MIPAIWTRRIAAASCLGLALVSGPAVLGQRSVGGAAVRGKPAAPAAAPKEPPAVSRCYTPQGETISAQNVMRDLLEGRNVDLQGRIIEGSLDADAAWPAADDRKTTLRVMSGRLRLDSCRIVGRLSLPKTVLLQDLVLTCTEVLGEVDLTDADLRGGFVGEQSRFIGEVRLNRLGAEGDLNFKNAFFEDSLEVSSGRLHGLVFSGAEIRGNLEVSRTVVASIDAIGAKIGGGMKIDDVLVLRGFRVAQTQLDRGMTVNSMKVGGPLDLTESHGEGAISLNDVAVAGTVTAPLTDAVPFRMTDVSAAQNLEIMDGHFGDVALQRVTVAGITEFGGARFSGNVTMSDCNFGRSFHATEALFERDVELRKILFPGDDPMEGALFARAPLLIETVLPKPPTVMSDQEEEDPSEVPAEGDDEGSEPEDDPTPDP